MRYLVAVGRFWYDFIVGDDWRIAAGVIAVLGVGAAIEAAGMGGDWLAPIVAIALVVVFAVPLLLGSGGPAAAPTAVVAGRFGPAAVVASPRPEQTRGDADVSDLA